MRTYLFRPISRLDCNKTTPHISPHLLHKRLSGAVLEAELISELDNLFIIAPNRIFAFICVTDVLRSRKVHRLCNFDRGRTFRLPIIASRALGNIVLLIS